jgi:hypothetical protein
MSSIPSFGDRAARADMLNQRARRRRSFGPAVGLTLRWRNGTWKQRARWRKYETRAPRRRRTTAAGPLPYPEFRRRQSTPLRINEVGPRRSDLGTGLGDLPVRVLPHSPQGPRPSPPPNAEYRLPQALRAHGRKTDIPGRPPPVRRPDTYPPYSYGRGQARLGRGPLGPAPRTRDGSYPCGFTSPT